MHKKVAVLLNNPIQHDYRVIKVITTLSQTAQVDLYYIDGNREQDQALFNDRVKLFPVKHEMTKRVKLLKHTFFCYEFNFFERIVKQQAVNYDIIWANDLPTLYPAYRLAKALNAQLVYDSHEIYTETINQFFPRNIQGVKGIIFSLFIAFMRAHGKKIEKRLVPFTSTFFTVNGSILDYFQQRYTIPNGKVLMNLPRKTDNPDGKIDYREQFSWTDQDVIAIYQGRLNEGRGLHLLVQVMQHVEERFKLVIVGDGTLRSNLEHFVQENNLEARVKFLGMVPLSELPKYTKGSDFGVSLLEDFNLSKKMASPNKLFEYIHSTIPIIASNSLESKKVFDQFNIGILVENDLHKIVEAFRKMSLLDRQRFIKDCKAAQAYYNWERQEEVISQVLA